MKKPSLFLILLTLLLIVGQRLTAAPLPAQLTAADQFGGDGWTILYADQYDSPPPIGLPAPLTPMSAATATFQAQFVGPWPAQAQTAFYHALNIWSSQVHSTTPIVVEAEWAPLSSGVLGGAAATTLYRNFPNAPRANTWYPVATANALAGTDLNGGTPEIRAIFNANFPAWYFGVNGQPPANQYDFVTVALHEVGHGLGFFGSMRVESGWGRWGGGTSYPFIYDHFAYNGFGQALLNTGLFPNPSGALAGQLTSGNIFFTGGHAVAANGGNWLKLYAPSNWQQGSSYSHLDNIFNGTPHALMTPSLSNGEVIHEPGPITRAILRDLGWTVGVNTPPTISGLPDLTVPASSSLAPAIDLWSYAADAQSPISQLTFTIDNTPNANAGVSVSGNRYLNVNPTAGWTGQTTVRIRVTDSGGLSDTDQFVTTVANTPPTLNPLPTMLTAANEPAHPTIDLWQYAFDYQTPTNQLAFEIVSVTATAVNLTLTSNRYLTIDPEPDWLGTAQAVIRVADSDHMTAEQTVQIIVAETVHHLYLPSISHLTSAVQVVAADNAPFYLQNFANSGGCDWLGVAGELLNQAGDPIAGNQYQAHIWNEDDYFVTGVGDAPAYGPSGWEQVLFNAPVIRDYEIQLRQSNGVAVSPVYSFQTRSSCNQNLLIFNFVQSQP
jgi:hypothetical protein